MEKNIKNTTRRMMKNHEVNNTFYLKEAAVEVLPEGDSESENIINPYLD